MTRPHCIRLGWVAAVTLTITACGGGGGDAGGGTPTAPSGNTGNVAATITIDANGVVSPKDVTVPAGSRVTFVNNHNRDHEMFSDPHPEHGSCPPLDQIGLLRPGQSDTSGNLNTPGFCGYHDHLNDTNTNLRGAIRVQ